MFKRFLIVSILVIVSYCSLVAQQSLVWKITGNGLDTPSYVAGTIHMICKEDFVWYPAMQKAMDLTSDVCLEINIADQSVAMQLGMAMMNTSDKKISSQFTKAELDQLAKVLKKYNGLTIAQLDMLKPVALIQLLMPELYTCEDGVLESYEMQIIANAQKLNKPIHSIESVETQLKALSSMPEEDIYKMAKLQLNPNATAASKKEYEQMFQELKKMISIYKSQDVEQLYTLSKESNSMSKFDTKLILENRNEDWIPKMSEMMKSKPVFFAFGAAHLGGEVGILHLLKNAGYTLTPILE